MTSLAYTRLWSALQSLLRRYDTQCANYLAFLIVKVKAHLLNDQHIPGDRHGGPGIAFSFDLS